MEQIARGHAVRELINQLEAGHSIPQRFHEGARIYFDDAVTLATPGTCVICGLQLFGQQQELCAWHWDWVMFEPLEENQLDFNPNSALIEFLYIYLRETFVITSKTHWQAGLKGHSRCELCNRTTLNVEKLVTLPHGMTLKSHTVCVEHATFRYENIEE